MVPIGAGEAALLTVWADIGAAASDSEEQALLAEDFDGPEDGVAAYVMLLLQLLTDCSGRCATSKGGD